MFPVANRPYLPWFVRLITLAYPSTDDPTPPATRMVSKNIPEVNAPQSKGGDCVAN